MTTYWEQPKLDNFAGTEHFVDFLNGSDSNGGTSTADAWKTIKYAVETGITRDATNGDRINIRDNSTHTVATNIDPQSYAATATYDAPLILQGYTTTPNDGGVAVISVTATNTFMNDSVVDFIIFKDLDISGSIDNDYLLETDRNTWMINCKVVNNGTTDNGAVYLDTGAAHNCYFESYGTNTYAVIGRCNNVVGCYILNRDRNAGISNATMCALNLIKIEGNPSAGDNGISNGGNCIGNAIVCTGGSANSDSNGIFSDGNLVLGNYVEGFGCCFEDNTWNGFAGNFVVGNTYYNVSSVYNSAVREVYTRPTTTSIAWKELTSPLFADAANDDWTVQNVNQFFQNIQIGYEGDVAYQTLRGWEPYFSGLYPVNLNYIPRLRDIR